jgi:hypothetical protein
MIEGIGCYFQQIADSIQECITEPWFEAWIDVVFFTEHIRFEGEYQATSGGPIKTFPTSRSGRTAFMDMREKFREANKPLWCSARFSIRSDGDFNLEWGYDGCDENGFAKFDEEAELKRLKEKIDR